VLIATLGDVEMRIVIEPEVDGDNSALFRLLVGEKLVAEGMTAAQIHILVGDILEQITLQKNPSVGGAAGPTQSTIRDETALPEISHAGGETYDGSPV
jgi:hypothetical protein